MSATTECGTVHFSNVGRNKSSWSERLPELFNENTITRMVRKKGVLMSSVIDAEYDDEGNGVIIVGGFREVGTFKISTEIAK